MRRTALVVGLVAGLVTGTVHAEAAPAVEVVDLGTLGGARSVAVDVNNAGVIVGWAETADGQQHAVKWDRNGRITDLGTLGGQSSRAVDINERGEIAGTIITKDGWGVQRAARWDARGVGVVLDDGGSQSWSVGIDDNGVVTGTRQAPNESGSFTSRVFRWERSGRLVDFGPRNGGEALAASSRGTVAGTAMIDDAGTTGAARWDARGNLTLLESHGGTAYPKKVNNAGVVIGDVYSGYLHAVRWDEQGRITDLGTLPGGGSSSVTAINDDGLTVGSATTTPGWSPSHAVRWDQQGRITDLGTLPGGTSSGAHDVNRHGTIVGWSDTSGAAWDEQGRITELPGLGDGSSVQALAVNDRGIAVGYTYPYLDQPAHALLWRLP